MGLMMGERGDHRCSGSPILGSWGQWPTIFLNILSLFHFKPGLRYVGGITGLMSSRKLPISCIARPTSRTPPNDGITTIRPREIAWDIYDSGDYCLSRFGPIIKTGGEVVTPCQRHLTILLNWRQANPAVKRTV